VSWSPEEMIISLFMEEAPASKRARRRVRAPGRRGVYPPGDPAREHHEEQQRHRLV
jgi:hypothetical protein